MSNALISALKRSLSSEAKLNLHYCLVRARYAFDFGRKIECPICGRHASVFASFNSRANAMCPRCFSLERHRMLYLHLQRHTDIFKRPLKIFHFAAEKCLAKKLRQLSGANYVTADSLSQFIAVIEAKPDRIMSITDIPDPPETYDLVICSHVLEHVVEDAKAMGEIHRVLKPGGTAFVLVPINYGAQETLEDLSLGESERRRLYGSPHHVRYYAEPDFIRRLEKSGFQVSVVACRNAAEARRFVLNPHEHIFLCRK